MLLPGLVRARFPNGLVISPCLSDAGAAGSYVLEVHSDSPVTLQDVSESKSKTLAGEWVEQNAGGSHLHASCKQNPKYKLAFEPGATSSKAKVKIVLSRPENEWKSSDTVGAMMGFYLNKGASVLQEQQSPIVYDGRAWNESPFVPMNAVSTPPDFTLETSANYIIMPAT